MYGPREPGLGFQCRGPDAITPGSLRAGAGCDLYARTGEPSKFSCLARHQHRETARRYLQESAAALALARVPRAHRDLVRALAAAAPGLLAAVGAD